MKISSRAGRFKKKLVSYEELVGEAPKIEAALAPLLEFHRQKTLTDSEFTAIYVLLYLSLRYPGNWLGSKRPPLPITHQMHFLLKDLPFPLEENIRRRLPETLGEVFTSFALKSTPETVNRALLSWSGGSYPLHLLFHIPKPSEVLELQKRGNRCVTVMTKDLDRFVLGERDPLSFTMHDLIHADHFYFDNHCYEGQISLYWFLDYCLKENLFGDLMKVPEFLSELEYLISDMNAYAIHSLKCLRSALIHYHPAGAANYSQWVKGLPQAPESLGLLNTPSYSDVQYDHILLDYLSSFRR